MDNTCAGDLRNSAQPLCPHSAANSAGVNPSLSRTSISIPLATKTFSAYTESMKDLSIVVNSDFMLTSSCPCSAASCKGVPPRSSVFAVQPLESSH